MIIIKTFGSKILFVVIISFLLFYCLLILVKSKNSLGQPLSINDKKCLVHKNEVLDNLQREQTEFSTMKMMDGFSVKLDQIFYSSKLNVCLYSYVRNYNIDSMDEFWPEVMVKDLAGNIIYQKKPDFQANNYKDNKEVYFNELAQDLTNQIISLK
jgi:hypothetical protein